MHKPALEHRILVVDDNHDAAELLQMLLQIEGYEVQVAFDGTAALLEASRFHPQVVCSDLHMPLLSGIELAVELRKSAHSNNAHLIALTGLDDQQTRYDVAAAGFDSHFCKPLDFERFFSHLRSIFEQLGTQ